MSKSLACAVWSEPQGYLLTLLSCFKSDLATAFLAVLGNEKASREIFNISGEKYVTFDGLARACAKAGGFPEPDIVHYNLKSSTLGRRRLSLSVTSISLPRWRKQSMFLDGNQSSIWWRVSLTHTTLTSVVELSEKRRISLLTT
ncbi:unnamed protein product [Brassica rapa]|uniref:Uncharacterized protein n=1 Tax=Brassica campestris TaxID=3711 RepID=A0A8D9G3X7_BRACM|nr:unnamed protein product [Brassica rapa]